MALTFWRRFWFDRSIGRGRLASYLVYLPVAIGVFFLLSSFQRSMKFHPSRYPDGLWARQAEVGAEDVWLTTRDGVRIHGWMIPAPRESELATLYFHGNAGNLSDRVDHMAEIPAAGSAMLIISYRGYGKSEGAPDEPGIYIDADAAYDHLLAAGYTPSQIVVYGESLGTAVAVDLASRRPLAGVILEAPFPSAKAVAQTVIPFIGPLLMSGLETEEKIGKIKAPIWIIHGDRDGTIAYKLGRRVFEIAPEPKEFWTIPGAGHGNIIQVAGAEYRERLAEFFKKVAGGEQAAPVPHQ